MSDSDIGDLIPTAELDAVSVFPNGTGYSVVLIERDGPRAYTLSEAKLRRVFAAIGEALQPGLLESLGFPAPYRP